MARFSHRPKRLGRQRESHHWRSIMPVAWIVGLAGAVGMGAITLDYSIHGRWEEGAFIASAIAASVPVLTLLFRFLRGHFSDQLRDP